MMHWPEEKKKMKMMMLIEKLKLASYRDSKLFCHEFNNHYAYLCNYYLFFKQSECVSVLGI